MAIVRVKEKGKTTGYQNTDTGAISSDYSVAQGFKSTKGSTSTPTVISDSTIRDTTIPDLKNQTQRLLGDSGVNSPQTQQQLQYQQQNPQTQDEEQDNDYAQIYKSVLGDDVSSGNDFYDSELQLLSNMQKSSDRRTSAAIGGLTAQYDVRREQLARERESEKDATKNALLTSGGEQGGSYRYAPISSQGLVSAQERAYIRDLSVLDLEEQQARTQVESASEEQDYRLLGAKLDSLKDKRKEKLDIVNKMYDAKVEEQKQRNKDINAIVLAASKGGASPEQISLIASAKDVGEATMLAGDTLQEGEYAEYRRAARGSGITPVDAGTYYARKIYGDKALGAGSPLDGGSVPFQSTIEGAASYAGSVAGEASAASQMANLAAGGDYPALLTRMEGLARKGMGATPGAEVATAQNQIKALKNMSSVLKEYKALGGDMNFLKGKSDEVAKKIGTLAVDPRFASIATQLTAAFQVYRQQMTGAAFGAKENAEYKSVFPSSDKSFTLNDAVIDGLSNYYKQNVNNAYETQLGEGYLNLKDYVDNGLTPTGKKLIKTEQEAEDYAADLSAQDPEFEKKYNDALNAYPEKSHQDILEILGASARSNEVSMGGNRPTRNNNPGNIKASSFTRNFPGVKGEDPSPAEDGGKFLTFATPRDGLNAMKRLITTDSYSNLSVDRALKRWSNNGYGADIAPQLAGKTIKELTPVELDALIQAMATREGFDVRNIG